MDYSVMIDFNGHTYLQYRDMGKTRAFVSMVSGVIETIQLTLTEIKKIRLKPLEKGTPEQFAAVYLGSYVEMTRSARAILRGIMGYAVDQTPPEEATRFSGGSVSLQEICELRGWDPQKARKYLRKLVEKPGGRWEWSPEEAEKIATLIQECLSQETTK